MIEFPSHESRKVPLPGSKVSRKNKGENLYQKDYFAKLYILNLKYSVDHKGQLTRIIQVQGEK